MIKNFVFFTCLILLASAAQAEIYVVKNRDGSVTFTNRTPKEGQQFEIFRPSNSGASVSWERSFSPKSLFTKEFEKTITEAAESKNIDENLLRAVIHAESSFNPYARSPKGAMGLMQLMPGTAKDVGVLNPFSPTQNINGGAAYLASLLDRYSGDIRKALAAYNAGPLNVDQYGGVPPFKETREYVKKVLALHRAYKASAQG